MITSLYSVIAPLLNNNPEESSDRNSLDERESMACLKGTALIVCGTTTALGVGLAGAAGMFGTINIIMTAQTNLATGLLATALKVPIVCTALVGELLCMTKAMEIVAFQDIDTGLKLLNRE
jgi:hypothetical protein